MAAKLETIAHDPSELCAQALQCLVAAVNDIFSNQFVDFFFGDLDYARRAVCVSLCGAISLVLFVLKQVSIYVSCFGENTTTLFSCDAPEMFRGPKKLHSLFHQLQGQ